MRGIRGHFLPRYGSPRLPPARGLESRLSPSQLRLDSRVGAPSQLPAHPLSLTLARGVLGSVGNGWYAVLKGRYLPLRPARTVLASVVGPIAGGMFT